MTEINFGATRRTILTAGVTAGAAAVLLPAPPALAGTPSKALPTDPFTLGVASGDPDHDGFVIWTRLAPQPLAEDGMGGMPNRSFTVHWEVAEDDRFHRIVRRGASPAVRQWGHSVHVELAGLRPNREYWYRFRVERYLSPAGRTRTAPHPSSLVPSLAMAFASCSQYEHGYFTAYRRLAEDHPDLVLHLGDYQYEYKAGDYVAPGGNPRDHQGPETETLANYRQRHAQYKADPDLQAAHAVAPWVVVWDDHEVDNNWADEVPERPDIPQPNFLARRTAAFRAYYENMPLRRTSVPRGIDLQLYRRVRWGALVNFHMLDTRQYRDDQACGDGSKVCPEAAAPERTITGAAQERWLLDGMRRSGTRWDVLGQQVFFAQRDTLDGPDKRLSMDAWDGYSANRRRVTQGWIDAGVRNPVVLTGDVHTHWAADVKLDFDDPAAPVVGSELVCSSITSGGDGADSDPADNATVKLNPHVKFYNAQRGYVRTTITPELLTADFRVVPVVSAPGAAAHTRATFVIEDRVPGVHQTYDRPRDN
ncbi:alkaline phosphatase D family protein [Dactylosporangium sp. AC04546]|uniref:alkaline phosphatase D family protein n=1 Tax=Dactylosporangium sp. AC04546 TaxID=2862460 RepID=UPI001EDE9817|nr:alkaline phosphatase D family protein [Dactylosporangium sp. AC04546]WVK86404.1 alkaline phosphatase D family protein [Dactylosporangium sp. AC04546]